MKFIPLLLLAASLLGQTPVVDTVFAPTGGTFNGRIVITAPNQMKWDAKTYSGWQKSIRVTNGVFNETLVPNTTAEPVGTSYHVQFVPGQGTPWVEYWIVPETADPVKIADIRISQAPTPSLTILPGQIKPGTPGYCMTSGINGGVWEPCHGGGDTSQFEKAISSVTSVTIPQSEHGLSGQFYVQVYGSDGLPVEPGDITFSGSGITVTFAVHQSGTVVLRTHPAAYVQPFTTQTSISIPAETHMIRAVMAINCRDQDGNVVGTGEISISPTTLSIGGVMGQSSDLNISFATPQTGSCIIFGA